MSDHAQLWTLDNVTSCMLLIMDIPRNPNGTVLMVIGGPLVIVNMQYTVEDDTEQSPILSLNKVMRMRNCSLWSLMQ